jgi:hypothetical protein
MKKVAKKTTVKKEVSNEDLAVMVANGFSALEARIDSRLKKVEESVVATRGDILNLHDKFIHRREFDQLSLRVSKLEEKARK